MYIHICIYIYLYIFIYIFLWCLKSYIYVIYVYIYIYIYILYIYVYIYIYYKRLFRLCSASSSINWVLVLPFFPLGGKIKLRYFPKLSSHYWHLYTGFNVTNDPLSIKVLVTATKKYIKLTLTSAILTSPLWRQIHSRCPRFPWFIGPFLFPIQCRFIYPDTDCFRSLPEGWILRKLLQDI